MYIVRLVFINMESEDHKFIIKKEAEEFLESTLSSEQDFCNEIIKPIFTKIHTYDSQVRTLMLLEEIGVLREVRPSNTSQTHNIGFIGVQITCGFKAGDFLVRLCYLPLPFSHGIINTDKKKGEIKYDNKHT